MRIAAGTRALCAVAALSVWTARAEAQPAAPVVNTVGADRTLTVSLAERTTLQIAVRFSPPELTKVRAAADLDRDGKVSADEANKVLSTWATTLRQQVSIATGKGRVGFSFPLEVKSFEVAREAVGLEGPVAGAADASSARVAWTFDLRMSGNDDRLLVEDAADFLPFARAEVVVKDSPTRKLVGLGAEEGKLGAAPQLSWVDAGSAGKKRTAVVTWTPPPERPWWMTPLALVLGIGIAAATMWSVRH